MLFGEPQQSELLKLRFKGAFQNVVGNFLVRACILLPDHLKGVNDKVSARVQRPKAVEILDTKKSVQSENGISISFLFSSTFLDSV